MGNFNLVTVVQLICLLSFCLLAAQAADYSDLRGPYCERRPGGCCPGRMDECSFPILGTLCYCDEFCNRTRSEDCCPDYWTFCKGQPAPSPAPEPLGGCYHAGRYYGYGDEVKINCNKCKCDSVIPSKLEFLCEHNICLVDQDLISSVNSNRHLGWTASNYSMFWGKTLDDGITYKTGTLLPHKTVKRMMPVKKKKNVSRLPMSFDARSKWPGWISGPGDQGWCGASWAVSTASVASDRYAIMSKGLMRVSLSPQHLLSCNKGQRGCQGGHLSRAWTFIRKFGLVDETCYPWTGTPGRCKIPKRATLASADCPPIPSLSTHRKDLFKVGPAYKLKSEEDIMEEIMTSGPVQATMKVYQDFFSYKSGVYTKSSTDRSSRTFGYHSVKILGWGEELGIFGQPIKYWLAANSWGPNWGENGFFKIRRGTNECEIEEFVLAVWAETDEPSKESVSRFQAFQAGRPSYVQPPPRNISMNFDRWPRPYV